MSTKSTWEVRYRSAVLRVLIILWLISDCIFTDEDLELFDDAKKNLDEAKRLFRLAKMNLMDGQKRRHQNSAW